MKELFIGKMRGGGIRPEVEGCQGGYELRIIYCENAKKKNVCVGVPAERGCLSVYELIKYLL